MAKEFFFGASTSSHQVEGGNHNDWTEWEQGDYISGNACDHYHRFRQDFDIAKSLAHNAHRFSIEWSRIEPEEGKFNQKEIEHYREVLNALHERGLEPFVTIWHWTLPLWLTEKGGLLNKNFPDYFARYATKLAQEFKDVRFWITINEPEIICKNGYLSGRWPPQKKNFLLFHRAMRHLVAAHRIAYNSIKKISPATEVGATMNMPWFESAGGFVNDILVRTANRFGTFYFLNRIKGKSDFIGLNYYFHNRVDWGFNKNKNEEVSDMGWEIYPEGLYHVLKDLRKYQLPIYITENGVADARDLNRKRFIVDHISWMRKAMHEGADVRGYFHWSLLDNFEWDSGFWPRFGLVEIDYKTLERKVRSSALEYKKIIEEWN